MRYVFLADFGLENDVSMHSLLQAGASDDVDALLLGGDLACKSKRVRLRLIEASRLKRGKVITIDRD